MRFEVLTSRERRDTGVGNIICSQLWFGEEVKGCQPTGQPFSCHFGRRDDHCWCSASSRLSSLAEAAGASPRLPFPASRSVHKGEVFMFVELLSSLSCVRQVIVLCLESAVFGQNEKRVFTVSYRVLR